MRALLMILLTLASVATAQTPPAPDAAPRAAPAAAGIDAAGNDAPFEGRVAAYLLSPDAGVAGLIFDDGRQVAVPPHLGVALAALIQPGQQARIGARRDDARGPGGQRTITAVASGQTLAETARDDPRASPPAGGTLQPMQADGTVRLRLRGPRGETNGLLLDNGTQVFFPPHVANEAGEWLRPGAAITVEGYGRRSRLGTVIQATRISGAGGLSVTVYGPADARHRQR